MADNQGPTAAGAAVDVDVGDNVDSGGDVAAAAGDDDAAMEDTGYYDERKKKKDERKKRKKDEDDREGGDDRAKAPWLLLLLQLASCRMEFAASPDALIASLSLSFYLSVSPIGCLVRLDQARQVQGLVSFFLQRKSGEALSDRCY